MIKKPKTLFYDIETGLMKAVLFGLGEQQIRHNQLLNGFNVNPIICVSYAIDNGPVKTLSYDITTASSKEMIEKFDKLINSVDIVIGKNNHRFDDKHINTQRMLNDLPGMDWFSKSDDLEKQMRRHFYLPSQSLDFISAKLGLGGKIKMDFSDWLDILKYQSAEMFIMKQMIGKKYGISLDMVDIYCQIEYNERYNDIEIRGKKALKKMEFYNRKDVRDTRAVWNYCLKHFKPKFNVSTFNGLECCTRCGSRKIQRRGTEIAGKTKYQIFYCTEHGGRAGRKAISTFKEKKQLLG